MRYFRSILTLALRFVSRCVYWQQMLNPCLPTIKSAVLRDLYSAIKLKTNKHFIHYLNEQTQDHGVSWKIYDVVK